MDNNASNIGPHAGIVKRVKDELGPWDVLKELRRPGSLVPGVRTALLFSEARKNLRCGFLEDRQCEKRYNSWVNYVPGNVVQPKTSKQSWATHRGQHMSAEVLALIPMVPGGYYSNGFLVALIPLLPWWLKEAR